MLTGCGRVTPTPRQANATIVRPTVVLESLADVPSMLPDPVQIALSPDGSRVVAVSPTVAGDNLVVWDSRSGSILSQWEVPRIYYTSRKNYGLQCSADAKIVCCSVPNIVIWDTERRQEIANLGKGIAAVSFDGKKVAAVTEESPGDVVLLNSQTGAETGRLNVLSEKAITRQQDRIGSLWFSPDGDFLIVQSNGPIEVWDLQTMTLASRLWGDPASRVVFSTDGQRMATHGNQTIRIWDVKNWKELHYLDQSEYLPRAMAFSSDGNSLRHHHDGNEIYLWDVASAEPIGAVQLLDEETSNEEKETKTQGKRYTFASSLTIFPNGRALVTKQTDGMSGNQFWGFVYDLDMTTAKSTSQTVLSEASVETPEHLLARIAFPRISPSGVPTIRNSQGITISPDSSQVAVFGRKDVLVIDASDPGNRRSLDYPEDSFYLGRSPAWSRAGNLLGTLGTNIGYARTIVQWNVETGERTRLAPDIPSFRKQQPWSDSQDVLTCFDYSPDGRILAVGNQAGNVILIDSGSGEVLRTLDGTGRNIPIKQVVFVDGGTAIVGYGFEVLRWELAKSYTQVKPRVLFKPAGNGFVMSANAQLGASVIDRSIEIVVQELSTGKVVRSLQSSLSHIEGMQISADGKFVAAWPGSGSGSDGGVVECFHVRQAKPATVLRHPRPRYWNRHAETQAVAFADNGRRIISSDTQAIWIWENDVQEKNMGVSADD